MIVSSLKLVNFRNHLESEFNFNPNINVLIGPNGVGKTNIIEAIYYLSIAKSFKKVSDYELINHSKEKFIIQSSVVMSQSRKDISCCVKKDCKKIICNNKPITKFRDLSQMINVVLFEPKDVLMFKDTPKVRRSFLDVSIAKKSPAYLDYLIRYEKVLKQRNEILKSPKYDENLLEATTEILVKLAGAIVSYRTSYLKDINDILIKITRALTRACKEIKIIYKPFVKYDKDFEKNAIEAFRKAKEKDLIEKSTTIGIHREDFSITINGKDIGEYGSQGENRIIALALKLSPYFLIEDEDEKPIVLLDDVMSELDDNHQNQLIQFLKKFNQVFITATKLKINGAHHYDIQTKKEVF